MASLTTKPISMMAETSDKPALQVYDGKIHCAFRGKAKNELMVMVSSDGGANWTEPKQIGQNTTSKGPSLCVYGDRLYCAFKAENSGNLLSVMLESPETGEWSDDSKIGGNSSTESPAIASIGYSLQVAFKADHSRNLLVVESRNGHDWGDDSKVGQETTDGPALVQFQNRAYCFFKASHSNNLLGVSKDLGSPSSQWHPISNTGKRTELSSAVVLVEGGLTLAYVAVNSKEIQFTSFNGTTWSNDLNTEHGSSSGPAITALNPKTIVCVYRGNDDVLYHFQYTPQ